MPESNPHIHGIQPYVSALKLVEATGEALTQIKKDQGLTWADVGEAIGKSEDMAAKYASGIAVMDFTTWLRACQRWNGCFSVAATMLGLSIVPSGGASTTSDVRKGMVNLTLLLANLQIALLDDDLSDDEVAAMDVLVEAGDRFLEDLKLRVANAKAANAKTRDQP